MPRLSKKKHGAEAGMRSKADIDWSLCDSASFLHLEVLPRRNNERAASDVPGIMTRFSSLYSSAMKLVFLYGACLHCRIAVCFLDYAS
jgi:hypothetical protein